MSAVDKNKSLLVTGKLSYGCTDLSLEWPHGGTGLGLCGSIFFEPPAGVIRLPQPENNTTEALLYVGGDAVLGASLEGWDDTVTGGVLAPLFPGRRELTNGRVVLEWPGSTDAANATQAAAAIGRTFTFAAIGKTITASSGSFVTDGFAVGMTLTVGGTGSNDGTYTITVVTALVLTVSQTLVNEGPIASVATLNADADSGGTRTARQPGTIVPVLSPLVFTARNPDYPSVIVYKAAVLVEASARLRLSSYRPMSVPLLFVGTPDSTGRVAAQGRRADLQL